MIQSKGFHSIFVILSEKLSDRDLQGHTRDGTNGSNTEYASAKEGNSTVNPNLSVNPIMPSLINPFPISTAKELNSVKPTHNKANKGVEKNNAGALKAHGKGNPQQQHPDIAPSVLESKSPNKGTGERRASTLKHQYPGIAGVGNSITKKRRQKVLAQHIAKFPDVAAKTSTPAKKSKLAQAPADPALPKKQPKTPRSPPLPHVRGKRLDKVSKKSGGTSTEDPITID